MKKPPTSIIGQILSVIATLLCVVGVVISFGIGAQTWKDFGVAGFLHAATAFILFAVLATVLFGVAELLNAVVRTAAACEEIAKQQRELRRS